MENHPRNSATTRVEWDALGQVIRKAREILPYPKEASGECVAAEYSVGHLFLIDVNQEQGNTIVKRKDLCPSKHYLLLGIISVGGLPFPMVLKNTTNLLFLVYY
jgi:hypothetical protein